MLRNATRELRRASWAPQHAGIARSLAHLTARQAAQSQAAEVSRGQVARNTDDETFAKEFAPRRNAELRMQLEHDKHMDDLDSQTWNSHRRRAVVKEAPKDTSAPQYRSWFNTKQLRRRVERRLHASKSWQHQSPTLLLKAVLVRKKGDYETRRMTAMARSMRLPVVLMQMQIRQEEEANADGSDLLELLPPARQWEIIMRAVHSNGHTDDDLNHYLYILQGETDEVRCERFLERDTFKPIFILNFLLRSGSAITKVPTLVDMMNYCHKWFCTMGEAEEVAAIPSPGTPNRSLMPSLNMTPDNFTHLVSMFAYHCLRIEPRLLVKMANIAVAYMEKLGQRFNNMDKTYTAQCLVFNATLKIFQPTGGLGSQSSSVPNAYYWEAQRILLEVSGGLQKPLLLNQEGFRAIRNVLTGLPKNYPEIHSARLHAQTWPPYLQPGDGIDEQMDPEESWTRAVRAGLMMQEAGFSKAETDESLDILQGLAPDGTPTIQQRTVAGPKRNLGVWATSIKATRNAHEAWERFQHPPKQGQSLGVAEYAAMFEKLCAREADPDLGSLPGDNSLNYPTHEEANLTEFEKARLRPPSVDELYQKMRLSGIKPSHHCLRLLVSNADSLSTAHRYLIESTAPWKQYSCLLSDGPDPARLRKLPLPLFSAYIDVCAREGKGAGRHLMRAIRLAELRLKEERSPWVPFIWAPILKHLGQHHVSLGLTLADQLSLVVRVLESIQSQHGFPDSLLYQLSRCMQKITRREVKGLLEDLKSDDGGQHSLLRMLYDVDARESRKVQEQGLAADQSIRDPNRHSVLPLLNTLTARMKQAFNTLVAQERESGKLMRPNGVSALDAMLSRRDPVKASQAHEYVLSLAYAGEFEEIARVVKWLMQEWGQPELVEEMEGLDELPREADMFETLCAFRAFAEPMLEPETTALVYGTLNATRVGWSWPDDEMVEAYTHGRQEDDPKADLRNMLLWIRHRQQQRQQDDFTTTT